VSDYNTVDQKYRRRICDDSTTKEGKVRFDWPITGLTGWCRSGGTLSEDTPCAPQPDSGDGRLKYDLRNTKATAYRLSPNNHCAFDYPDMQFTNRGPGDLSLT
jgi:hypothetical protein